MNEGKWLIFRKDLSESIPIVIKHNKQESLVLNRLAA